MNGYSPIDGGGIQRTELHCHDCGRQFVAELDFDVNGDHVIECPHCEHEHYRAIRDGVITDRRWGSANDTSKQVKARSVWKSSVIQAQTSSVSAFLRDRWLNRSDIP